MSGDLLWSEAGAAGDVQVSRRKKRRLPDTEMDITPMIDITFLLLIFFVVASKMDQTTDVKLPPARFGMALATKNAVTVTVAPGPGGVGSAVYKGDGVDESQRIDSDDLAALEQELEEFVADAMLEDSRKRVVLVKAGAGVKHREVARVTQAVSRVVEVEGLHVAVLEE